MGCAVADSGQRPVAGASGDGLEGGECPPKQATQKKCSCHAEGTRLLRTRERQLGRFAVGTL